MLFSACGPEQIEINHQKEKGGRIRVSPNNNKYGLTSRLTHNRLANQLPLNLPSCFRLALDQVDTDFLPVFVSPAEQERDLGVAISGNGGDGGGDGGGDSVGSVNFPRLKF